MALLSAAVVVVSGSILVFAHGGDSVRGLIQSSYGRTLALKLAAVAGVAGVGFYNWRRVRPQIQGGVGSKRFVSSAGVELALACLVLLLTAVLTGLPRPGE